MIIISITITSTSIYVTRAVSNGRPNLEQTPRGNPARGLLCHKSSSWFQARKHRAFPTLSLLQRFLQQDLGLKNSYLADISLPQDLFSL